ncbi:abortive infection family protein [Streptomyces sp. XH2]|uniref:abortive infection family protein n=1 Tax=Streptomyces sp. XH2 TaxID=3412483 RepID=UPI003C7BDAE8
MIAPNSSGSRGTARGLAELRSRLGLGHGRVTPSPAPARHARLALNSAVAVRSSGSAPGRTM